MHIVWQKLLTIISEILIWLRLQINGLMGDVVIFYTANLHKTLCWITNLMLFVVIIIINLIFSALYFLRLCDYWWYHLKSWMCRTFGDIKKRHALCRRAGGKIWEEMCSNLRNVLIVMWRRLCVKRFKGDANLRRQPDDVVVVCRRLRSPKIGNILIYVALKL